MILHKPFALILLLLVVSDVVPAFDSNDGTIVERVTYQFPSYEKALQTTNIRDITSKEEYERAIRDTNFEFQRVKYMSDGLKVTAYLYKPTRISENKLPAIIFNRGSLILGDIAPELVSSFHRLASQGFVVLAPMYRQSDGGQGRDEMGGADVNDLMNAAALAKSLGFIDVNNLFLYGESRGGVMTYLAIKKNFPANAAAVYGAFTDMEALIKDRPQVYRPQLLNQIWPEFESRKDEIFRSRSAIFWPESLGIPLLIMHGGADWSVNPSQSLTIAQKLQSLGKTYELIIYAGDSHRLARNQEDRDRRAVAWFRKHRKPRLR
ncbi:MAG TPA: prolyl oligopeptidase family serine peptidase [Pyrinomonadaceae bacterium]|nr:prolyl oligopeptidase family serine peptidase [Pyrinomonadaceae bacterium]